MKILVVATKNTIFPINIACIIAVWKKARTIGIPTLLGVGIVPSEPELIATALRPDYCVLGEGEGEGDAH
jgi:hypothetical protein